jgi:outer membrane protein assembly factor BamE (lipoprotein component of BamABCDE complex)
MKNGVLFLSLLLAAGCAHKSESPQVAGHPGHIKQGSPALMRVGMTKEELLSKMGPPASVSTEGGAKEVLYYKEERARWNWKNVRVVLIDGKVTDFRRVD